MATRGWRRAIIINGGYAVNAAVFNIMGYYAANAAANASCNIM